MVGPGRISESTGHSGANATAAWVRDSLPGKPWSIWFSMASWCLVITYYLKFHRQQIEDQFVIDSAVRRKPLPDAAHRPQAATVRRPPANCHGDSPGWATQKPLMTRPPDFRPGPGVQLWSAITEVWPWQPLKKRPDWLLFFILVSHYALWLTIMAWLLLPDHKEFLGIDWKTRWRNSSHCCVVTLHPWYQRWTSMTRCWQERSQSFEKGTLWAIVRCHLL